MGMLSHEHVLARGGRLHLRDSPAHHWGTVRGPGRGADGDLRRTPRAGADLGWGRIFRDASARLGRGYERYTR
jgi:hypothetical protein